MCTAVISLACALQTITAPGTELSASSAGEHTCRPCPGCAAPLATRRPRRHTTPRHRYHGGHLRCDNRATVPGHRSALVAPNVPPAGYCPEYVATVHHAHANAHRATALCAVEGRGASFNAFALVVTRPCPAAGPPCSFGRACTFSPRLLSCRCARVCLRAVSCSGMESMGTQRSSRVYVC